MALCIKVQDIGTIEKMVRLAKLWDPVARVASSQSFAVVPGRATRLHELEPAWKNDSVEDPRICLGMPDLGWWFFIRTPNQKFCPDAGPGVWDGQFLSGFHLRGLKIRKN
jgi:hypothetical protein